jgi:putative flippase GtrA
MKLIKRHREIIVYGIVGGGTTAINLTTYLAFAKVLNIQYLVSNVLAWISAFAFAFLANKLWVFQSKSFKKSLVLREMISFLIARGSTGIMDNLLMFTFVDLIGLNDLFSKVVDTCISIIFNYILSKFWIFKKKEKVSQRKSVFE